jgi:hypothetical protein
VADEQRLLPRREQISGDTTNEDDIGRTLAHYVAMWNETDTARRAELVRTAWRPDGRYTDPQFTAVGHAALERMIATAQEQFHDHHLRSAVRTCPNDSGAVFTIVLRWPVTTPRV